MITGEELNSIALKGRDFFGLMYTLPGVVDTSTGRDATSPNAIGNILIAVGRNGGGTISVITKGDGQEFHGSGRWQHRNEDMNANSWANNRSGPAKPKVNSSPVSGTMPTVLERTGDFSKSFDTDGSLIPVIDPTTGKQFTGNIIPNNLINPTGAAVLNFFPVPNYAPTDPSLINQVNYTAIPTGTHTRRNDVVRGDWYITPKLNAYFDQP